VVRTSHFGDRNDCAEYGRLDRPVVRRIRVEREVSAKPVVVREGCGEDSSQVPLAENDDMVQALAPD
jgi:hypothetical protein